MKKLLFTFDQETLDLLENKKTVQKLKRKKNHLNTIRFLN